ncbi:hypothetical protein HDU91_003949, partial [Kappamyces sp. JEL0680]
MVEKVLVEQLMPPNIDHTLRTRRCLQILSSFNEKQQNAFNSILDRQVKTMGSFAIFIDYCIKFNVGGSAANGQGGGPAAKDDSLEVIPRVCAFLSARLPDPKKAEAQLLKFAELNNGRLFKLIRAVMDPVTDYKLVLKHNKEIASILSKTPPILEVMAVFLRRISLCLMNKDTMSVLLKMVQNATDPLDQFAETFFKDISRIFPALNKTQVDTYMDIIVSEQNDELVADAIEALAQFAEAFPQDIKQHEATIKRLVHFATAGTEKQSRHAAVILAKLGRTKECRLILQ